MVARATIAAHGGVGGAPARTRDGERERAPVAGERLRSAVAEGYVVRRVRPSALSAWPIGVK
ncbi:hypothetical protein SAMN05216377_103279 [Pseudonocardia oroxyli]|uniref:Uncharacterized protein n=1 Tax=Pseudonocardia oroxyli TaxID=366584 RepID=A0A1G7IES3_PSEOR|nr:hypothetical protein SAMN05216377_103279 [Pseudonocardia oroxyli]